eukprot:CAMPEP_0204616092 /NCGR_PEP_ID=MMETSP0717-20131115/3422_1 /ASSEMBLY_ACC=CAM_ASM_000666 /TAXON_ID=230516 /ORGANISM="Chaetoceros curvisetus" /LENGTH=57 /DNA_ID=CAMNT_0051629211 /DNA_START=83 /DNA_END=256 /DNA_ORIENTATION=-
MASSQSNMWQQKLNRSLLCPFWLNKDQHVEDYFGKCAEVGDNMVLEESVAIRRHVKY